MTTVIHVNQEVNENSTLRSDPDSACILGILDGAFRYKVSDSFVCYAGITAYWTHNVKLQFIQR